MSDLIHFLKYIVTSSFPVWIIYMAGCKRPLYTVLEAGDCAVVQLVVLLAIFCCRYNWRNATHGSLMSVKNKYFLGKCQACS